MAGIRTFRRAESLNDFPPFLDALADAIEPRLQAAPRETAAPLGAR